MTLIGNILHWFYEPKTKCRTLTDIFPCQPCIRRENRRFAERMRDLSCNEDHENKWCESCAWNDDSYPYPLMGQWIEAQLRRENPDLHWGFADHEFGILTDRELKRRTRLPRK